MSLSEILEIIKTNLYLFYRQAWRVSRVQSRTWAGVWPSHWIRCSLESWSEGWKLHVGRVEQRDCLTASATPPPPLLFRTDREEGSSNIIFLRNCEKMIRFMGLIFAASQKKRWLWLITYESNKRFSNWLKWSEITWQMMPIETGLRETFVLVWKSALLTSQERIQENIHIAPRTLQSVCRYGPSSTVAVPTL